MIKQQIKNSACFMGVAAILYAGVYLLIGSCTFFFSAHRTIFVNYTNSLPISFQHSISQILKDCRDNTISLERIRADLKKDFPELIKMTFDYRIPKKLTIHLFFDRPIGLIYREYESPLILSEQGHYAAFNHYEKDFVEGLPFVIVQGSSLSEHHRKLLYEWFKKMPSVLFETYTIYWRSPTQILLSDVHRKNIEYVIDTNMSYETLDCYASILYELTLLPHNKKYKNWKIDMRFKDRCILAPSIQKKGVS